MRIKGSHRRPDRTTRGRVGFVERCGKFGYEDRAAAKQSCRRQGRKGREYLCPRCGFWHLTSIKDQSRLRELRSRGSSLGSEYAQGRE